MQEKQKLIDKPWFIATMLLLVWPLGLYFVWRSKTFSKIAKIWITAAFFITLAVMMIISGDSKPQTENLPPAAQQVNNP